MSDDITAELGELESETHHRADDGRRGVVRRHVRGVAIDIDWGHTREQWASALEPSAIEAMVQWYGQKLSGAGFRPVLDDDDDRPPPRLEASAARRFLRMLGERNDSRMHIGEADLRGDRVGVSAGCKLWRNGRTPVSAIMFDTLLALGGDLWLVDDDGALGPPDVEAVVAELAAWLQRHRARTVRAVFHQDPAPILRCLRDHGVLAALTHAVVRRRPGAGEPPPGLLSLTGAPDVVAPWLGQRPPMLEALTLSGALPSTADLLELPALRHLGLWYASSDASAQLLDHVARSPLAERLDTLDLFDVNGARGFPFGELLARREALAGVRRIHVPGHLVSAEARAAFEDWPAVRFVSHDRLETVGYDLLAIGFPGGAA